MKLFPNLIFEPLTFDKLYFFNTLQKDFSRHFDLALISDTFNLATEISVTEQNGDDCFEEFLFNNLPHNSFTKKFNSPAALQPWLELVSHGFNTYLIKNNVNSIQIYSDPVDWDICIIGSKEADNQIVKDWLIIKGIYERRMKSIDEFHAIWQEIATPKMFEYAMLNLKEKYMPYIQ